MLEFLKNWNGAVEINGQMFDDINTALSSFTGFNGQMCINLYPKHKTAENRQTSEPQPIISTDGKQEYRITVKKYMTEQATPSFDFMAKWNDNKPMPLRTMTGWVEKETRGMSYMHLHGDIWAETITTCMCCGRLLTNPVSQYFGIGPECGGHNYTHPFSSDKELKDAVSAYKKKLQAVTWEGWVVKSAITEMQAVGDG